MSSLLKPRKVRADPSPSPRSARHGVTLQGYLQKQNPHGIKSYKKRWFVLMGRELMYYERDTDVEAGKAPLGKIELSAVERVDGKKNELGFTVSTPKRDFILQAYSRDERAAWVSTLRRLLTGGRRPTAGASQLRPPRAADRSPSPARARGATSGAEARGQAPATAGAAKAAQEARNEGGPRHAARHARATALQEGSAGEEGGGTAEAKGRRAAVLQEAKKRPDSSDLKRKLEEIEACEKRLRKLKRRRDDNNRKELRLLLLALNPAAYGPEQRNQQLKLQLATTMLERKIAHSEKHVEKLNQEMQEGINVQFDWARFKGAQQRGHP